jgi:hypothetical protein
MVCLSSGLPMPVVWRPRNLFPCGYAEAMVRGSEIALEGIRTLLSLPQTASREEIERAYRQLLRGLAMLGFVGPVPTLDLSDL